MSCMYSGSVEISSSPINGFMCVRFLEGLAPCPFSLSSSVFILFYTLALFECIHERGDHRTKDDGDQCWKNEHCQRDDHFRRHLVGNFLCPVLAQDSHLVCLAVQYVRKAHPHLFCLDDDGDEAGQFVNPQAVAHIP